MRGFYLHIPFCSQKCHYCNFVITTRHGASARERFFAALEKELNRARQKYGRLAFDTLYLGGGTPSLLSVEEMTAMLAAIREKFDFNPGYELTCEVNPGDGDEEKFAAYHALGINRISIGAQSFNDLLLRNMGRGHNAEDIHRTANRLRHAGFQNISMDFILRLPQQSLKDFTDSLAAAVDLNASQISLYDLEVHENTIYGLRKERGELMLPDEDRHVEMIDAAESYLAGAGYFQYEASNFARPGMESRHNLIYWKNREYLGFGPGAFSYLDGRRFQFASDMEHYLEKCEAGNWTPDTEDILSAEEKEMETLVTGLRLREGIDLNRFDIIRGRLENKIPELVEADLVERCGDVLTLTKRGRFLLESTMTELVERSPYETHSKSAQSV